jgi:hypothetical protein
MVHVALEMHAILETLKKNFCPPPHHGRWDGDANCFVARPARIVAGCVSGIIGPKYPHEILRE